MASGRPIRIRDRGWVDVDHLRVFGPFTGITPDGLRTALVGLHAARPDHPAVCVVDGVAKRWVPLCTQDAVAHLSDCVSIVDDPGSDDGAADAVTRYLAGTPMQGRCVLLAVCRGFVGAKVSHVIGDGRVLNALLPELLRAGAEHRPANPPRLTSAGLALPRAVLHHFGRHPARVLRALPQSRPPATDGGVPWRPDPAYVSVRSTKALGKIRTWRDSSLPGVSAAAIQFASLVAALDRCGLPVPGPGLVVLVDARRYLPKGRTADGNFSWGLYLQPDSLTDPRAIQGSMAAGLSSGSALVMLTLRAGRLLLMPGHADTPAPREIGAKPAPRLTLTHIGRLDPYVSLPWAKEPAQRYNISAPTTAGPESITASFSDLAGVLYLNLSFHRSTFDPLTIRAAAQLACEHPVELVSG